MISGMDLIDYLLSHQVVAVIDDCDGMCISMVCKFRKQNKIIIQYYLQDKK